MTSRKSAPKSSAPAPSAPAAPKSTAAAPAASVPAASIHQVLSRKYRPQGFGELRGQEHVERILRNALASGRVGHAYLFVGPRGVGKTTTARIFARALNCTGRPAASEGAAAGGKEGSAAGSASGEGVEPCGTCASCRDIASGVDLDVVEIDGASHSGVEDVRTLREQVGYAAVRARYRIWIVDEVHMLSLAAFNAFLKTLEEPPPKVKFIFCTTEEHKLPDTFRSRCQRVDFRPIAEGSIAQRLADLAAREGVEVEPGLCEEIARGALGGLRDAESLLEQLLAAALDHRVTIADLDALSGRAPAALLASLRAAVAAGDAGAALDAVDGCLASGGKPGVLLDQWLDALRRDLAEAARAAPGQGPSLARVARSIDVLLQKRAHLRAGADGVLVAQVAAVELARLPDARDLDRLIEALGAGERVAAAPEPPARRSAPAYDAPSSGPVPSRETPPRRPAPPAITSTPPAVARSAAGAPAMLPPGPGASAAGADPVDPAGRWTALVAHAESQDPRLAAILRRISPGPFEDGGRTWRLETADAMARTAFDRREMVLAFRRSAREVLGREVAPRVVAVAATPPGAAATSPGSASSGAAIPGAASSGSASAGSPNAASPTPPAVGEAAVPRARLSPREAREHPSVRLVTETTEGTLLDVRPDDDDPEDS